MNTIKITSQEEFDNLPCSFEKNTVIEILSEEKIVIDSDINSSQIVVKGNSRVVATGNSSVVATNNSSVMVIDNSNVLAMDNSNILARGHSFVKARDKSSVIALDNSSVKAWEGSRVVARGHSNISAFGNSKIKNLENSITRAYSSKVTIEMLLDYSTLILHTNPLDIIERSKTATMIEIPRYTISFEEWLRRGYVVADGIHKELVSRKTVGKFEVFKVKEFGSSPSFVVKLGDTFSHGNTFKEAVEDLKYKDSDRDTSSFEYFRDDLNQEIKIEEAITSYRVITGACRQGVKEFVESTEVPEVLTPKIVMELTVGKLGHDNYRSFLEDYH